MKHTNALIKEKSPYLLQHAHNPVNWQAWGEEAFAKAQAENKLVLVSIGYSSCHWCHVMEHQSFEDEQVAAVMNEYFINIKVDREERPDVDHVYMTAVQLMTGRGGWPLNCFALPDGRPVYGGIYFSKEQWVSLLYKLADLHKNDSAKVEEYAKQLSAGIKQSNELLYIEHGKKDIPADWLAQCLDTWKARFDTKLGGNKGAPKFPMPVNYLFLLRAGHISKDEAVLQYVHLTLQQMAHGGIYDQVGGGFARYSVDEYWKVPHFEKMLYDNAQLISLYSEAYRQQANPLYKQVVYETIDFIKRELSDAEGGFYSALDADSEGVEGLFYTWTGEELKELLGDDFAVFADYYSVNEKGYWEDERYILLRDIPETEVALRHQLNLIGLKKVIAACREKLLLERNKRVRPGLDDKVLTSWNALLCGALCDAYLAFMEEDFLEQALRSISFMEGKLLKPDHSLFHCYKREAYIEGFLEDYAFLIAAYIKLFSITGQENYLEKAEKLVQYTFGHFYDAERELFFYAHRQHNSLISSKIEWEDNVIPSSNSQMAINLFLLSKITGKEQYSRASESMMNKVYEEIIAYGGAYANWAMLGLYQNHPFYELCIVGKSVNEFMRDFSGHYHPNAIFVYSKQASEVALLSQRYVEGSTQVYVCENNSCKAPVNTIEEAIAQMA